MIAENFDGSNHRENDIVIVEKWEETGCVSWALKRTVIERRRGEVTRVELHSSNLSVVPVVLDSTREYRIRGRFLRKFEPHEVDLLDREVFDLAGL